MTNVVINRILRQRESAKVKPLRTASPKPVLSPPIEPELLRRMLEDAINTPSEPAQEPASSPTTTDEIVFEGIGNFGEWLSQHREGFTEPQRIALGTVEQAYASTLGGCKCTAGRRARKAEEYLYLFWVNNRTTDLPEKIKAITNVKKLKIIANGQLVVDQ